tara:strand:+ start:83 stop:358 length:276 start_codon:yes stop_codon:yes gene_type:complete
MKRLLVVGLLVTLLNGCASYDPLIDSNGRSKFENSNAEFITNDKILCKEFAEKNTSFFSNLGFWIMSPRAETQYTDIYRKCMIGRNHSVMN